MYGNLQKLFLFIKVTVANDDVLEDNGLTLPKQTDENDNSFRDRNYKLVATVGE